MGRPYEWRNQDLSQFGYEHGSTKFASTPTPAAYHSGVDVDRNVVIWKRPRTGHISSKLRMTYKTHAGNSNLQNPIQPFTVAFRTDPRTLLLLSIIPHLLVPHHPMLLPKSHPSTTASSSSITSRRKRRTTPNGPRSCRRWWFFIPLSNGRIFGIIVIPGIDLGKMNLMLGLDVAVGVHTGGILGLGV